MTYESKNAFPHDCTGLCPRCEHEDAAERVAIQHDGQRMSAETWRMAVEFEKARRRPGQRQLSV